MKVKQKLFLAGIFLLGMGAPEAGAQGLFFGMMSAQTPTIYNEHYVRDINRQQAKDMFHAMDANKDAFVSAEEFNAVYSEYFPDDPRGKMTEKRYQAIDKTGAGKVSKSEFIAYLNTTIEYR